jgi:kynurenine formamidase
MIVDVSHPVHHGMVTYPGLPGPDVGDHLSRADSAAHYGPGVTFHIARISLVGNTGTYVDSPFHRYADGTDLAGLPLDRLADVEGVVVRVDGGGRAVDRDDVEDHDVAGRAVLVHTGWARHWGTDRYGAGEHPFLTAAAVAWLVDQGATLVGIDSLNVDDADDPARPAHSGLLAAGIPIVEHLCDLDRLPDRGFRFHAVPAPIVGASSFPVRAYAVTT